MIVGFQARGTLGRAIVDGTKEIRLWGEVIQVNARVHTVGGLSAHADQQGLMNWYGHFKSRPPVVLVHGEPDAMDSLATRLKSEHATDVLQASFRQKLPL
jgi:metallo-beta-lactamase family protein